MDFGDMVRLARKGTRGILIEEPHEVTEPWQLAWQEVEEEEFGVRTARSYNAVYCPYVPPDVERLPSLFMQYELPFWRLRGKKWNVFKKRVVGFSRAFDYVTDIFAEGLDDLRDRLTGEWCGEA